LPLPHYCRNYFKIVHLNKKRNYCYLLTKLHKAFSQSLHKEKKYLPFTPTAGIISTFNIFKKREISVIYLQSCNKAFSQSLQKEKRTRDLLPHPHTRNYFNIYIIKTREKTVNYLQSWIRHSHSLSNPPSPQIKKQKKTKIFSLTPTSGIISTFYIIKTKEIIVIYLQSYTRHSHSLSSEIFTLKIWPFHLFI
jgi:hypothetical protein